MFSLRNVRIYHFSEIAEPRPPAIPTWTVHWGYVRSLDKVPHLGVFDFKSNFFSFIKVGLIYIHMHTHRTACLFILSVCLSVYLSLSLSHLSNYNFVSNSISSFCLPSHTSSSDACLFGNHHLPQFLQICLTHCWSDSSNVTPNENVELTIQWSPKNAHNSKVRIMNSSQNWRS